MTEGAAPSIIAFCNPLLDISVTLDTPERKELLSRYGLLDNDVILATAGHKTLLDDIRCLFGEHEISYGAGGAGLNSLRAVQRQIEACSCWIVGCIGCDAYGRVLIEKSEMDAVRTDLLKRLDTVGTGTCVCLIHDDKRSLVASPDAGNAYSPDFISQPVIDAIRSSSIIYITGFFVACCPAAVARILAHCSADGPRVMFNFSAGFVGAGFGGFIKECILKQCEWVIGNVEEVAAFLGADRKDKDQLTELQALAPESSIIITDGPAPVRYYDHRVRQSFDVPIPAVPKEEIVDTNGAGDGFVGGLLASFLAPNYTAESAVRAGANVAAFIIRHSGIQLPLRSALGQPK